MRYQGVIDVSNKNNSHTLTIDFIKSIQNNSRLKILDVGCSSGYLGEYLKTLGHYVVGLDITYEAIEVAKNYLDEAYNEYLEDYLKNHPELKFDVIIFGDVLEHITNPDEILKLVKNNLEIDGKIIASIPNVAHISMRCLLLEGRWEYADLGLLDKDHVRFFTKNTILKMFEDAGLLVNAVRETKLSLEQVDSMCKMNLNPSYIKLVKKIVKDDEAEVFQYVVCASVQKNPISVVCYVPTIEAGLFNLRLELPLKKWMSTFKGSARFKKIYEISHDDLVWGDIFIFQRVTSPIILNVIKSLKNNGKKVIFEIDDLLTELPSFLSHHALSQEMKDCLYQTIQIADLVTTTTERLANELSSINPKFFSLTADGM
jgi:2-polyprenyl-3-methyl-5-hydroxy-6-metoxy-1,4-benzoquinol methylase